MEAGQLSPPRPVLRRVSEIIFAKGILVMSESEMKAGLSVTSGFGMPLFGILKLPLTGVFGELVEHETARAQQGYDKIKSVSDGMAEALRETYSNGARSATDYGLKIIEISNANTASAIDFFKHLLGSKSVSDVITLSAARARKGFDDASAQNTELWQLAQRLAMETGEPVRKRVTKVFKQAN
jgi:phasin